MEEVNSGGDVTVDEVDHLISFFFLKKKNTWCRGRAASARHKQNAAGTSVAPNGQQKTTRPVVRADFRAGVGCADHVRSLLSLHSICQHTFLFVRKSGSQQASGPAAFHTMFRVLQTLLETGSSSSPCGKPWRRTS